jgi:hypothetical protein
MAYIQGDRKDWISHEAEVRKKLIKKLGEAEIDSIDSPICVYEFLMPMRFSHAHDVHPTLTSFFYANARGLRERIQSRRRFAEDGVH